MDQRTYSIDQITSGVAFPCQRDVAPRELTWRHRLMAFLMVHGCADSGVLGFVHRTERVKEDGKTVVRPMPPPAPGEPLTAAEAGRLVGLRLRYAKSLARFPIFEEALEQERLRLRGKLG